jgi:hypothetical protein
MNKLDALNTRKGQTLIHKTRKNSNGLPYNVRVNGKVKTWQTRPNDFQLPVKRGLYDCGYITHHNGDDWQIL